MLDARKAIRSHEIVSRYADLKGKKVLEIGSGYGTKLIVWVKRFGIDLIGVEPEGEGFISTAEVSRELCRLNDVDPGRILGYQGESLPFPDGTFDVVYSANVLEHTERPASVLDEAFRVLKPGGLLHLEMPNFLTPFEGHYFVVQPPILWKGLLPFWVKAVFGRDPSFARTLRTEINPIWLRRTLGRLGTKYRLRRVSFGEEIFRERLREAVRYETRGAEMKAGPLVKMVRALNVKDLVSRAFILLQAHYPIYLTVIKEEDAPRA